MKYLAGSFFALLDVGVALIAVVMIFILYGFMCVAGVVNWIRER